MSAEISVQVSGSHPRPKVEISPLWFGAYDAGLLGVFAKPVSEVLGLRAWDDAPEGLLDGQNWTLFDIEKFARMMLRQSVVAFDALVVDDVAMLETRGQIATWAMTDRMPHNLQEAARGCLAQGWLERAAGYTAMARLLATRGVAGHSAEALIEFDAPEVFDLPSISAYIEGSDPLIDNRNVLPPTPSGYDQLNAWVVATRLSTL